MTKKPAILCLAVGNALRPPGLDGLADACCVHHVSCLKEAQRLLVLVPVAVGLLLLPALQAMSAGKTRSLDPVSCAQLVKASSGAALAVELEAFLHAHWRVRWIALMPADMLDVPHWRRLVAEHCHDFHTLPLEIPRLQQSLGHARGLAALAEAPAPTARGQGAAMVGNSAALCRLRRQLTRVAAVSAPVLISGESGSGKELVAQAVHGLSARRAAPFVPVNCGAMPASLIHSELFGHERGAFTGAHRERRGLIEAAHGGTLFLDEIGDLPLELQANLLRFLQEQTLYRLGSTQNRHVDVRVIAASHVDLAQAVARGAFREDLYYRLNVLVLEVPALRARPDDVIPLARHFFEVHGNDRAPQLRGFSTAALQALQAYHWPGNVRELLNCVRRAMVMAEGKYIMPADLGLQPATASPLAAALDEVRVRAEREAIAATLLQAGSNVTVAARRLGVSRMTLYRLLAKHGISAPSHKGDTVHIATAPAVLPAVRARTER